MDRLTALGSHPFKADSKMQPNCCARFIFGGNHDRTLERAFGNQSVNPDDDYCHQCLLHAAKVVHKEQQRTRRR